jgi:hypothetical protein
MRWYNNINTSLETDYINVDYVKLMQVEYCLFPFSNLWVIVRSLLHLFYIAKRKIYAIVKDP